MIQPTGTAVMVGDTIVDGVALAKQGGADEKGIVAGEGAWKDTLLITGYRTPGSIVALRPGIVHWEGSEVSVLRSQPLALSARPSSKRSRDEEDAENQRGPSSTTFIAPSLGSTVHMSIRRVTRFAAHGEIVSVEGSELLQRPFPAVIRQDDARDYTADELTHRTTTMTELFRPGDVILADVVALGDGATLQLSTKAPHGGVIQPAPSMAAGAPLLAIPGNRRHMRCSATGRLEPRWVPLSAKSAVTPAA